MEPGSAELGDVAAVTIRDRASLREPVAIEGPLPAGEACTIVARIAEGVAGAHAVGVVHRSISPDALRRGDDGEFRLAATASTGDTGDGSSTGFAAPETRRPGVARIGAAADVYSLGATLLHLVTGKDPSDLEALASLSPGPLPDLIAAAMDFDPARRPSSLELHLRLAVLAELFTAGAPQPDTGATPAPAVCVERPAGFDRRRRRPAMGHRIDDLAVRVRPFARPLIRIAVGLALVAGAYDVLERRWPAGAEAGPDSGPASAPPEVDVGVSIVPVVVEVDQDAAMTRLDNAGLWSEIRWEFHPNLARGKVIASEPASGASAPVGSTVELTISRGTEPTCEGLRETAVQRQLQRRGLRIAGVTRSTNDTTAADLVLRCIIYDETETAVLVVSDGPGPSDR